MKLLEAERLRARIQRKATRLGILAKRLECFLDIEVKSPRSRKTWVGCENPVKSVAA